MWLAILLSQQLIRSMLISNGQDHVSGGRLEVSVEKTIDRNFQETELWHVHDSKQTQVGMQGKGRE